MANICDIIFWTGLVRKIFSHLHQICTIHFLFFPTQWTDNPFLPSWWPFFSFSHFGHNFRNCFLLLIFIHVIFKPLCLQKVGTCNLIIFHAICHFHHFIRWRWLVELSSSTDGTISELYTHSPVSNTIYITNPIKQAANVFDPFNVYGSVHRNNILVYNSNRMHKWQGLFNLTTGLHVSGVTITHLQEHKTNLTTASGNRYTVLLSAAIVEEYATHNTLKPVPTLPR